MKQPSTTTLATGQAHGPASCALRRHALWLAVLLALCPWRAASQGIPYLRNYMAADYQAHNRNFDVLATDDGSVFVANFEGLLYYDMHQWHNIPAPNIMRVTALFCDSKGQIWAGGYNFVGRVVADEKGEPRLEAMTPYGSVKGEVNWMWERQGNICFLVDETRAFTLKGKHVVETDPRQQPETGRSVRISHKPNEPTALGDVRQVQQLDNGLKALATGGRGLLITDSLGHTLCNITEQNGLCSNNVNSVTYDGHGTLWGATDNGVFAVSVPSAYSHFSATEGLRGEVLTILRFGGKLMVGTLYGLFWQKGQQFMPVSEIHHACWQLVERGDVLWAATSDGVYRVGKDGSARQVTGGSTTSLAFQGDNFYTGEMDGVYLNTPAGARTKVSDLEKVVHIAIDGDGTLWLQGLYGRVMKRGRGEGKFQLANIFDGEEQLATLVSLDGALNVIPSEATAPVPYPQFSIVDGEGTAWLTDNEAKHLYAWRDGKRQDDFSQLLAPFGEESVHALLHDGQRLWMGSDDGLTCLDSSIDDPLLSTTPRVFIRSVTLHGDSTLWGGSSQMPTTLPELSSKDHHLSIAYSIDYAPLVGQTVYRYRLNGGRWSTWNTVGNVDLANLSYGNYTLEVQARDGYGRTTATQTLDFSVAAPFYLRWYMNVLYALLLVALVYQLMRWRLKRLQMDKQRLESIVQERTEEVVKQKDEIEEKSKRLETALSELAGAQHELIRQEKMATVGKLTQGLIDRILNPLNYINNFSKLSEGLVKDICANIEDEKDKMDAENYEDTVDVLGMLTSNLQKVSEHGQNTTRTLKAMEEMLKDRSGGIVEMDLAAVLRQDEDMLRTYYAEDIRKCGIVVQFNGSDKELPIHGNPDQLSKTMMSMLGNAVYAVVKKAGRDTRFTPEIRVDVAKVEGAKGEQVRIGIRDNGIGIEESIRSRIFDPFFTTKTTGEASGVGLYLSHEVIQNHGGDIIAESVKNEYTLFTITLPV